MMLTLARVVESHPESHSVDIVIMEDGRRMAGVQVMASMAGTNVGLNDLPSPSKTGYSSTNTQDRDIYAVVSFINSVPIVLGFLFPQVSQCLFADKDRMVYRHASDVYVSIDASGNTEISHPSGTYLRIGETSGHEDLTGLDYDHIWKITKNTNKAVNVHLSVKNAGVEKASLNIDPSGNIALSNAGTLVANVTGNTTVTSPYVTLNTTELLVSGNIKANGTITDLASTTGRSMSGMRTIYNSHVHPNPEGGNVGTPTTGM